MAIFYFSFAIRYINYQYKLLILQPAIGVIAPVAETAPAKVPSLTTIYISAEQAAWLEDKESDGSWKKPENSVYLQKPMNTLIY